MRLASIVLRIIENGMRCHRCMNDGCIYWWHGPRRRARWGNEVRNVCLRSQYRHDALYRENDPIAGGCCHLSDHDMRQSLVKAQVPSDCPVCSTARGWDYSCVLAAATWMFVWGRHRTGTASCIAVLVHLAVWSRAILNVHILICKCCAPFYKKTMAPPSHCWLGAKVTLCSPDRPVWAACHGTQCGFLCRCQWWGLCMPDCQNFWSVPR